MMYIAYSVIVLFLIGMFGYFLADYLNKDIRNMEAEAKSQVRNRLMTRGVESLDFEKTNIGNEKISDVIKVLSEIANIIGVQDINYFRFDDRLKNILRVSFSELGNVSIDVWKKAGLGDYLEVYSYDILNFLNKVINIRFSQNVLNEISCDDDSTEDEIIDALFSLKLIDFLEIISRYMRSKTIALE